MQVIFCSFILELTVFCLRRVGLLRGLPHQYRTLQTEHAFCNTGTSAVPPTCASAPFNTSKFCDQSLTPEERAAALVADANLSTLVANLGIDGGTTSLPGGFKADGVRGAFKLRYY